MQSVRPPGIKKERNIGFIIKKPLIFRKMDKGILNVVEKPRSLPTCVLHSHRIWVVSKSKIFLIDFALLSQVILLSKMK